MTNYSNIRYASSGTTVYADMNALIAATGSDGDQALVQSNNNIYVYSGTGWYKIATVQNDSPSAITGVSGTYSLETDGTPTVITAVSTDPEGFPLTWSYSTSGLGSIATVSQVDNVFTITPSTNSADFGTFTLTINATDGVNGAVSANTSITLQFIIANSRYTTLLATATGTSDNSNITDSSTNNHSITVNGDAHAGTFSPYRHGGYSTYFDGSVDYIKAAGVTAIGTADFTFEAWINPNGAMTAYGVIVGMDYNTDVALYVYQDDLQCWASGSLRLNWTGVITPNEWQHVALVRNSGTLYLYRNGVQFGTSVVMTTNFADTYVGIGAQHQNGNERFKGHISNARYVRGTAVYTANFTPPTSPLTAISGTNLLTCQNPTLKDESSSNHTITVTGSPSIEPFSPYDYDNEYSTTNHGGSVYFDGTTGNNLDITPSAANLGTGDFTVECWAYWSADPRSIIYDTRQSDGNSGHAIFMTSTTHNVVFYDNNATVLTSAGSVKQGIWNHIAVVRNSGTINIFINGKKDTAQATGNSTNFDAHTFRIGEKTYGGIPNVTGNITDFRISSTPRYTADFTPPSNPLSSDANTSLLISGTDASIIDKSQGSNLKLVGNTTGSTTQVKFTDTKSMYFDGTGDYLQVLNTSTNFLAETLDTTIEMWVKTSAGGHIAIFSNFDPSSPYNGMEVGLYDGYQVFYSNSGGWINNPGGTGVSTINNDSWHHLAWVITNNGTTVTTYVDGTQNYTSSITASTTGGSNIRIGASSNTTVNRHFTGYIQDFRFTKGLARYTANFTPPTAPLKG